MLPAADAITAILGEPVATAVEQNDRTELPAEIVIDENYPNPFRTSTRIRYQLQRPFFVTVSVFDLNGQLIKRLLSEDQTRGIHDITWDGKNSSGHNVACGTYLVRISNGSSDVTKKVILAR